MVPCWRRREGKKKVSTPKGLRLRKTVRGNQIGEKTVQININVLKEGTKKLPEIFPDQNKKEEPKTEENKENNEKSDSGEQSPSESNEQKEAPKEPEPKEPQSDNKEAPKESQNDNKEDKKEETAESK